MKMTKGSLSLLLKMRNQLESTHHFLIFIFLFQDTMFMSTEALSVQKFNLILSLLQDLVNFIRRVYPEFSQQLQLNITSHAFDGESSKFRKFVSNLILIQTIDKMT